MLPFEVHPHVRTLIGQYPDAETLRIALPKMSYDEREEFLRTWLTEGIPYAFRDVPMLYASARKWLSHLLNVSQENITMVGSARIGFSLAGKKRYGIPFRPESDIDLAIVNEPCFEKVKSDFYSWKIDFEKGVISPRSDLQLKYWLDNSKNVPNNIRKGFIDTWKIPNYDSYSHSTEINRLMYRLIKKMSISQGAPSIKGASLRIYNSWDSLVNQINLNLNIISRS